MLAFLVHGIIGMLTPRFATPKNLRPDGEAGLSAADEVIMKFS